MFLVLHLINLMIAVHLVLQPGQQAVNEMDNLKRSAAKFYAKLLMGK